MILVYKFEDLNNMVNVLLIIVNSNEFIFYLEQSEKLIFRHCSAIMKINTKHANLIKRVSVYGKHTQ